MLPSGITMVSVTAVAVGVLVPILVLAVMGGFESDLRTKILGSRAHLLVTGPQSGPLNDVDAVMEELQRQPGLIGASRFVESDVMASSTTNYSGVVLRGIVPDELRTATNISDYMSEGSLEWMGTPERAIEHRADLNFFPRDEVAENPELQAALDEARSQASDLRDELDGLQAAIDEAQERRALRDASITPLPRRDPPPPRSELPPLAAPPSPVEPNPDARRTPPPIGGNRTPPPIGGPRVPPTIGGGGAGSPAPIERREPRGIVIGSELQETLNADVGDVVQLINPDGDVGPTGMLPRSWPYRVVGVFHTGLYEFDNSVVYMQLEDARAFLNVDDGEVTGIELRAENPESTEELAPALSTALNEEHSVQVRGWEELNRNLFAALKLEKVAMAFVLLFITIVASFAVFSVLIMIVLNRRDEIAILRAMGASKRVVRDVFMVQGFAIGLAGSLIGSAVAGVAIATAHVYGIPLDPEIYYIDKLPIDIDWFEFIGVTIAALLISLVATIPPSVQAARLDPAQGLRHE